MWLQYNETVVPVTISLSGVVRKNILESIEYLQLNINIYIQLQ
jgi:hypothetical protein